MADGKYDRTAVYRGRDLIGITRMISPLAFLKQKLRRLRRGRSPEKVQSMFVKFRSVGKGVEIKDNVSVRFPETVRIGNHVYIGPRTSIYGRGGLQIHDHVIIGPEVAIMTDMHNYKDAAMVPYDRVELLEPVTIERCVWIGMRAIILPGVQIGEGSIIGTGAVLTKSCAPGSIMAGNPASLIRQRDMLHYQKLVKDGQFYLMLKQKHSFDKELVQVACSKA